MLKLLQDKGWTDDEIMKVELALQEALANGIRHGAKGDKTKQVQCCVTCDERGEILIVDAGFTGSGVTGTYETAAMAVEFMENM